MIEIVARPYYDEFMHRCASADKSIKLCAPYVKHDILMEVFRKKRSTSKISLITKINLRNFHQNSSDLTAIKETVQQGGIVFNCTTLHAKFYIFDDKHCFITSANLTSSGLLRNYECGIITDDNGLVCEAVKQYQQLTEDDHVGNISNKQVEEMEKILGTLPEFPKISYPSFDISQNNEMNVVESISNSFSGWKKYVFLALNQLQSIDFTSNEVAVIAKQSSNQFPKNLHREAKVRQVLQQLRDVGLIQFIAPGIYKILWR